MLCYDSDLVWIYATLLSVAMRLNTTHDDRQVQEK
jgi:hypothetical protein